MAETSASQTTAPPRLTRLGLDQAAAAAELLRQRGGGALDMIAHFWERLAQTPPLARADLHLVVAYPAEGRAMCKADGGVEDLSSLASARKSASAPLGANALGAMLYVPKAHRADILALTDSAADAFGEYIQRIGQPITSDNSVPENMHPVGGGLRAPAAINFITGNAEGVERLLPRMLAAVHRRAFARRVNNVVMRLPSEVDAPPMPNVREAKDGDEGTLNRWRKQYMEERGILFDADVDAWIDSRSVFVLEVDGAVVACAKFDLVLPGMVEIGGVFVFPEFRRRGYGASLVGDLAGRIRKMGRVATLQVDAQNDSALSIYRKAGWVEVGRIARVWLVSP
ncbi:MAG: GNAT family N-acetyltransferase [Phycisphaerales bacterium]|nr:GNAT family N-acetyltransferase [Phycisphaerales bacterium]